MSRLSTHRGPVAGHMAVKTELGGGVEEAGSEMCLSLWQMFEEAPLFRSSGWSHQAGEGGLLQPAWSAGPAAGVLQGPGSCHR